MARFQYENGVPLGKSYVFARNGSLREVTRYKDGKRHDRREEYTDGALTLIERFRNGERHGLSEHFLPYGERYMVEEYEKGILIRTIDGNSDRGKTAD